MYPNAEELSEDTGESSENKDAIQVSSTQKLLMVEKFAIVILLRAETLRVHELHGAHWLFEHMTMTSYGLLSETTGAMFCSLERQLYAPYRLSEATRVMRCLLALQSKRIAGHAAQPKYRSPKRW